MRHGNDRRWPFRYSTKHPEERRTKNTDQDCAVDLSGHQHESEHQTKAGGLHLVISKAAEADKGSGVSHHKFRIAQSDECNEESDARRGRMLQAIGHAVDDLLADSRESEHKKQDARKENDAQGCTPWNVHA